MDINDENAEHYKFLSLDSEKQDRIINAAMKEFTAGYKNASTDNIVKEAGISKGLIFHYFGTKEGLYNYLIDHAIGVIQKEFVDKITTIHPDILENIWHFSLLKGELSFRYPAIFDFVSNAYFDTTSPGDNNSKLVSRSGETQANLIAQIFAKADHSLFRDDIDPEKAIRIILWTVEGYTQSIVKTYFNRGLGSSPRENYNKYLEEFAELIGILRQCIYK